MADSMTEIGTTPFFPLEPNWVRIPAVTQQMSRKLHQWPGSVDEIDAVTPDVPIRMEMGFTVFDKSEEYDLVDFFVNRYAMVEKFWLAWPRQQFTLNRDHNVGEAVLDCYRNYAERQYQLYERIEILMNNGDRIVRKVVGMDNDPTETQITIDTSLDRDVDQDGYLRFSRLMLCRFDVNILELAAVTDRVAEINLPFLELVTEYDEV